MSTDYDKIRKDNIREYGEGTRHLAFLGQLYSDRTHFIFELLQNAEDAGAGRVSFSLFENRLEVRHNGREFNETDVRGVCGVGEGTKTENLTKIGKFGIGFKSVYAYSATPEIHSGNEAFKIESFVRPFSVNRISFDKKWTTLFIFRFNNEISKDTACEEIGNCLRNLSGRTLLFLRKINKVEYSLPNGKSGIYLREEQPIDKGRQVRIIAERDGVQSDENWLIFDRSVEVPESRDIVYVEVGFSLEIMNKEGENIKRVVKIKKSPLAVFFPTAMDTRFGFLVQGPYRTTPARDNIPKDDEWNQRLVAETAKLIREILPVIKNLGLLSISFLEALPIRAEDFPDDSMFYPIFESVRKAFIKEELLPADDGSYVTARNAKLARSANLRKVFNHKQLSVLFESASKIKWLNGDITGNRTYDLRDYIIYDLEVEEVTSDTLVRKISEEFMMEQSEAWFIKFYHYLLDQENLWRAPKEEGRSGGVLRSKPIIRLQSGV